MYLNLIMPDDETPFTALRRRTPAPQIPVLFLGITGWRPKLRGSSRGVFLHEACQLRKFSFAHSLGRANERQSRANISGVVTKGDRKTVATSCSCQHSASSLDLTDRS